MEFREFYRGVCAKIRFDYHTGTYIGELDGLPGVSYVEAGSYEDIQKSLKQAVDDHLSGRSMTSDKEWEMAAELEIMAAELRSLDEGILSRAQGLHAATVDARLDALTAVTEDLIEQRRATIHYLKGSHQKLIVHFMEHAMTGDRETARRDMAGCPIMKQIEAAER